MGKGPYGCSTTCTVAGWGAAAAAVGAGVLDGLGTALPVESMPDKDALLARPTVVPVLFFSW